MYFLKHLVPRGSKVYLALGLIITFLALGAYLTREYNRSFFSTSLQRVNIGIFGKRSMIVSYNLKSSGGGHTLIVFSNTYNVQIPGGLGGYSVGSIGKLAELEKKPDMYKKAMSIAGQLLLHRAQYKNTSEVYYDDYGDTTDDNEMKSRLADAFWGGGDLTIFERLFLISKIDEILSSSTSRYLVSSQKPQLKLYERSFRDERKLVQIYYQDSSKTAYTFASLLENAGIRVADIISTQEKLTNGPKCMVIESGSERSKTGEFLTDYFGCAYTEGETGIYDIHFVLDDKTEQEWGI